MTTSAKLIPTSSQTVGPYFRIGLQYMLDRCVAVEAGTAGSIEIRGRVLDSDGVGVSDAMLEFWTPGSTGTFATVERKIEMGFPRASAAWERTTTATLRRK